MADHEHWQLDGSAPELYQKYLVPAITAKWAEDIIDRARPFAGEVVLDIACGTGVVARLAAKGTAQGRVTGLDLNKTIFGGRPVASKRGDTNRLDRGQCT
jgi:ubiquinone/menaquinone biosynthesis C-methylase UbiE